MVAIFWEGLASSIKYELTSRDLPSSLDKHITLGTHIDIGFTRRQHENEKLESSKSSGLAPTFQRLLQLPLSSPWEQPMQVERLRLSMEGAKNIPCMIVQSGPETPAPRVRGRGDDLSSMPYYAGPSGPSHLVQILMYLCL